VLDKLAGSAPVTPIYLQVCSWAFPTAANDHRAITLCHRPKVGSCAEIHRSAGGRKYVEFATPSSPVKLALYGRRALAKDAGVSPDGTGSHRLMIGGDAGPFTDLDGFAWEAASV
jgi:hypothetical protein